MQDPRREQPVDPLRLEGLPQPVPARDEHVAQEFERAAATEQPQSLSAEERAVARPQLCAEQPEREVGDREEAFEHGAPGFAVAVNGTWPPLTADADAITV